MYIPHSIRSQLSGDWIPEEIGRSQASVYLCGDKVLKAEPVSGYTRNETEMLSWLQGKLPVPRLLGWEEEAGVSYLLMQRLSGKMACDACFMRRPDHQCKLLARGLRQLWSVDVSQCPIDQSLDRKLSQAEYNIATGLADFREPHGFPSREALLSWLKTHRPREERVLSHGDYCLPNVFLQEGEVSGFLDLGRCGVADRWCDIALCCRSLRDNYGGAYGKAYPGLDLTVFFRELGIAPDWDKIRYYTLLDELF